MGSMLSVVSMQTSRSGTGATRTITVAVLDSLGSPAVGETISFFVSAGPTAPASVQVDASGFATVVWTPYDSVGYYTLTGVRQGTTLGADPPGRVVIRRSVRVSPGIPAAAKSTVSMNATTIAANGTATITVTVKDAFGNVVKTAAPSYFAASPTGGTLGVFSCTVGVCTATYTAPATAGGASVSVTIGGVDLLGSPITLVIN
jgi:hypothetical protein